MTAKNRIVSFNQVLFFEYVAKINEALANDMHQVKMPKLYAPNRFYATAKNTRHNHYLQLIRYFMDCNNFMSYWFLKVVRLRKLQHENAQRMARRTGDIFKWFLSNTEYVLTDTYVGPTSFV